jgi:hypothetical protein
MRYPNKNVKLFPKEEDGTKNINNIGKKRKNYQQLK